MKKITGFICASVAVLALSGCSPSSADLVAGAVLQCEHAQFVIASGNSWSVKKEELLESNSVSIKNGNLTQEEADERISSIASGYIELAKSLGLSGDSSVKQSDEFNKATENYRNAVVDDDSILNPYLDEVAAQCSAVGVEIDLKDSDPEKYKGQ